MSSSTTRGPSTVLLVEDNPADAFLARRILADTDDPAPTVETEDRLAGAIQRLARGGVDVVALDRGLPDRKGLESFERLEHLLGSADVALRLADKEESRNARAS